MSEFKNKTEKLIKNYRNRFDYLHKRLNQIEGEKKKQIIEKHLQKYLIACESIKMFPEPQTCLDIVEEFDALNFNYHQ